MEAQSPFNSESTYFSTTGFTFLNYEDGNRRNVAAHEFIEMWDAEIKVAVTGALNHTPVAEVRDKRVLKPS